MRCKNTEVKMSSMSLKLLELLNQPCNLESNELIQSMLWHKTKTLTVWA